MKKRQWLFCAMMTLAALVPRNGRGQTMCFLELNPTDDSLLFQIQPDLNYQNVVAFVNYYSNTNKLLISTQALHVTDGNLNKYIQRDSCTTRIFPVHIKGVDHVKLVSVAKDATSLKADGISQDEAETGSPIHFDTRDAPIVGIDFAAGNGSFQSLNDGSFTGGPSISGTATGNFYFFATKGDGSIYYSAGRLGGANSGWSKVDGQVSAASAPSSSSIGSQIFVAVQGKDNEVYLNQAGAGNRFNNVWQPLHFATDAAPSLVTVGNFLYVFAKDLSGSIYYNRAMFRSGFEGWKPVGGNTVAASGSSPSAGAVGNYIYLIVRGNDNQIYLTQATAGNNFIQWQPMRFLTYSSPAAVAVGQYIYFFATSVDGKVEYNYAKIGGGGVGWKMVNGNVLPAQTVFAGSVSNNYLFVAMKGNDDRFYLNQGGLTGPFNEWWNLLK